MALATRIWDRHGRGALSFTELGFGAAPLGNLFRAISEADARATLDAAWQAGIRYYDTAPLYGLGLSETRLNGFLRDKPRDDYVISTKIGRLLRVTSTMDRDGIGKWFDVPARAEVYDYGYDAVLRSLEFSLERLGLDRIDILFAHDLDLFNHGTQAVLEERLSEFMSGGYRALMRLRDEGVIRAFGAGVNEWQPCEWLAQRGDFDIFLLAGRYTLLEQEALQSFLPLCEERGIGLVIGGPYNSGILATGPIEGASYNYAPAPERISDRVAAIEAVCSRHATRLVDAAFRFPLGHPAVLSVIPGAQSTEQLRANLRAAGTKIPPDLWRDLKVEGLMSPNAPVPGG